MGVRFTKEQQQVIDLRNRNILVSAAAGSGKTAVLVERIITRLTKDASPLNVDQLLIVTFTEAAASEMKERIHGAIEKALMEQPDNVHLQQQALLQVACSDAGRLQFVDDCEQTLQLAGCGLDAERECYVVRYRLHVAAQVAILVNTAHQKLCYGLLPFTQVAESQLLNKVLLHRASLGNVYGALFIVLGEVIDTALVTGRIILADIVINGEGVVLLRSLILFENYVLLNLLFYSLLQLQRG